MKIRDGFVTNSSSTNFIIISKEELSADYLYKKLGFEDNSPLYEQGMKLCEEILGGTTRGLRWFEWDYLDYEKIKEIFGEKSAKKFLILKNKGFIVHVGHTSNDSDELTNFFTTDSFEIDERDFYINGKNCVW